MKQLLFNILLFPDGGWLVDSKSSNDEPYTSEDELRNHQMEKLRELCIPKVTLLLHSVMAETNEHANCIQLADMLASEQYQLYKVIGTIFIATFSIFRAKNKSDSSRSSKIIHLKIIFVFYFAHISRKKRDMLIFKDQLNQIDFQRLNSYAGIPQEQITRGVQEDLRILPHLDGPEERPLGISEVKFEFCNVHIQKYACTKVIRTFRTVASDSHCKRVQVVEIRASYLFVFFIKPVYCQPQEVNIKFDIMFNNS